MQRKPLRIGLAAGVLSILLVGLVVLAFPQPLFAYQHRYRNYHVWSDRPIDPAITSVLDDATRRLRTSELYNPRDEVRLFFCHDNWRLQLYSQRFSARMGGVTDTWLTRNIYLRASVVAENRIIPPDGVLYDAAVRPLSYFIAHEATHAMQSRAFGRLMNLRHPRWLTEGHADYVAKGGDFGYDVNRRLLVAGHPLLDPLRSGLYRRHHLLVAFLLDRKRLTLRAMFADSPREEDVLAAIKSSGDFSRRPRT